MIKEEVPLRSSYIFPSNYVFLFFFKIWSCFQKIKFTNEKQKLIIGNYLINWRWHLTWGSLEQVSVIILILKLLHKQFQFNCWTRFLWGYMFFPGKLCGPIYFRSHKTMEFHSSFGIWWAFFCWWQARNGHSILQAHEQAIDMNQFCIGPFRPLTLYLYLHV